MKGKPSVIIVNSLRTRESVRCVLFLVIENEVYNEM